MILLSGFDELKRTSTGTETMLCVRRIRPVLYPGDVLERYVTAEDDYTALHWSDKKEKSYAHLLNMC